MRVLVGHNHYQWAGGEDAVVKTESRLLEEFGHQVQVFETDNTFINATGFQRVQAAKDIFWSKTSYQRLRDVLGIFKPDVAHFHNIYFSLTPSVYDACRDEGVAVVQSLHNFRMLCANALFFRDGHVCEDCLDKSPWEGIIHRCYKHSVLASSTVTAMTSFHRWRKIWKNKVDMYITATEFTRGKYIQSGLPGDRIAIKPNVFCPLGDFVKPSGEFVLYVGRLSHEKGAQRLLEAWGHLPEIPLKVVGDGPLGQQLKTLAASKGLKHIEFLGVCDEARYWQHMQRAKFLVIPSGCYENFPRIAVEAYAFGLPILASRLGSLIEIIEEGRSGFLFDSLDPMDLASRARTMWGMDLNQMSARARDIFETQYSPAVNIRQLLAVYEKARTNFAKGWKA